MRCRSSCLFPVAMRSLPLAALSALAVLPFVHAQSSTASAFISGSPVILSALPSATATLYNNTNAPGAPKGKAFKHFMQIWLENEVRSMKYNS